MWNSKTARFSKFLSGGRNNVMGVLDGILYWVLLSLPCGMLPFLALGIKYTISQHDNPNIPQHPQTPLGNSATPVENHSRVPSNSTWSTL